jgi:shingomyelin synthase
VVGECSDERENNTLTSSQTLDNVITETGRAENASNGSVVMIASRDQKLHRSEQFKALCAFFLVIVSFFLALISLALTHDKLPDRKIYKPLPDVVLDNVKSFDFLLNVSEVQIIVVVNVCVVMVFFHKHR